MKIVNPTAVRGEDIATEFLKKKGYKILERNFRKQYGEIDIIALDISLGKGKEVLVFVEVKTRTSKQFGTPFESISKAKLQSVIKTGQVYKLLHPQLPESLRIDAVAIMLSSDNAVLSIELLQNISGF